MKNKSFLFISLIFLMYASACSLKDSPHQEANILDSDANKISRSQAAGDTYVAAASFSWDNYVSVGKDQMMQGPCYLFASVALVEAMVRLYYNKPTKKENNLPSISDPVSLSEQQPYSSWEDELYAMVPDLPLPKVNEQRTYFESTLAFAKYIGLVSDSVCPYTKTGSGPYYFKYYDTNQIEFLRQRIITKIPGYQLLTYSSPDQLKKYLIDYGPLLIDPGVHAGNGHGQLLVGWKTDNNGNILWEFASDSWPQSDPDFISFQPYYTQVSLSSGSVWAVLPVSGGNHITYPDYTNTNFFDNDGDGYYVWSFGQPKPSGCPGCDERDGDDNNPLLGPIYSSNLTYKKLKQSLEASSWGNTIAYKTMTVKENTVFNWTYYSYKIPGSGYYMKIMYNGGIVAYADEYRMSESGSFNVEKDKICSIEVRGGAIVNPGYTANFYGIVKINK